MSKAIPLIVVVGFMLAGCASSSPDMIGGQRGHVTLEGIDFTVISRETEAEVIRMGYLSRQERDRVPDLMAQAAQSATGCAVIPGSLKTRIPGDTGVARFQLRCF